MKVASDGKFIGSITMYTYEVMKEHIHYLKQLQDTSGMAFSVDCSFSPIWRYASPPEAYEVLDYGLMEPYYMHILFGLKNGRHVRTIVGIFITSIILLFDMIQMKWREIVHDIRTGQPDTENSPIWKSIPEELRNKLIALLQPPDEDLARTIENIMNHDVLPVGWGKLLFPGLLITQSAAATTFEHHCAKLEMIVGEDVHCLGENYAASEALLGIQENYTAINRFHHAILYGYTELLPEDQWFVENPQCISIDAAEINRPYEIVTTNWNGLYRYRMGDVIKYVELDSTVVGSVPVFQLCYRRGALLNHFGEKVTEEQLMQSILEAINELNKTNNVGPQRALVDYCATSINRDCSFYYTVFIELTPSPSEQELEEMDWSIFAAQIDTGLCTKNTFYVEFREMACLQPLHIRICRKGAFHVLQRAQIARGSHLEQLKVPRAIPPEAQCLIDVMIQHSTVISSSD
ncbi:hypothetical protein I4U23_004116 [Adineta vaga]|nr:hypothetical protein I4U23_004116 [Adineta vaga]